MKVVPKPMTTDNQGKSKNNKIMYLRNLKIE